MGKFEVLKNEEIIESLQGVTRQYLAGNLQKPQFLPFFKTELLEIGITSYEDFSSEPSHRHTTADEYQYMLSGRTQYMDVDTGDVHEYIKGDFYKISAGTSYAQRSKPGTEILFIKVPSINDKELVEESVLKNLRRYAKIIITLLMHQSQILFARLLQLQSLMKINC